MACHFAVSRSWNHFPKMSRSHEQQKVTAQDWRAVNKFRKTFSLTCNMIPKTSGSNTIEVIPARKAQYLQSLPLHNPTNLQISHLSSIFQIQGSISSKWCVNGPVCGNTACTAAATVLGGAAGVARAFSNLALMGMFFCFQEDSSCFMDLQRDVYAAPPISWLYRMYKLHSSMSYDNLLILVIFFKTSSYHSQNKEI